MHAKIIVRIMVSITKVEVIVSLKVIFGESEKDFAGYIAGGGWSPANNFSTN